MGGLAIIEIKYYILFIFPNIPDILNAVHDGAPDIRFQDKDDDALLDYEIELWDKAGGLAVIWVLVTIGD